MPGWLSTDSFFPLVWQISDQTTASGAVTEQPCACLQWSDIFLTFTQAGGIRDKRKKQGITLVIILMPWDVSLWIYECGFTSAHILSQEGKISGSHKWLTDLQGKRGNFIVKKNSSRKASNSWVYFVNTSALLSCCSAPESIPDLSQHTICKEIFSCQ